MRFIVCFVMIVFYSVFALSAQDVSPSVISAANIHHLQSALQIDWAGWTPRVDRGWLALHPAGTRITVVDREQQVIQLDTETGERLNTYVVIGEDGFPTTFLDGAFSADGDYLTSIHAEGSAYSVAYQALESEAVTFLRIESADVPLRVWANEQIWLEVSGMDAAAERYILHTEFPFGKMEGEVSTPVEWSKTLSGPENDVESFLRVGRIQPPLALTVTQDNLLKHWNLETGEVTATTQLDTLPAAGQVNADQSHLAWVDQQFQSLHLLDFETGEDQVIASLGGTYIPFLLLTAGADVMIGVNVGNQPNVVAWDVGTGERIDLGEYRSCNRQPDMVRLSRDGSVLVIGCDTGLDIWRIES